MRLLVDKDPALERICPIFCVSAVRGDNIDKVNYFLAQLLPRTPWKHRVEHYVDVEAKEGQGQEDQRMEEGANYGELEIDETFAVRGVGLVVSGTVTGGRVAANQHLFLGPFADCSLKEILVRSVHMKRVAVAEARAGESCSVSLRFVKRKEVVERGMIRKGMVAVSSAGGHKPRPVWGFTCSILVLHHPTTINEGYQPVVHCGNIRQTATIMKMSKPRLRSGDSALIDLKFLGHPELLHSGRAVIIREGSTKCIGKVIQLYPSYDASLSDFAQLTKRFLNHRFEAEPTTMIFDERHKIVTKQDLHQLEHEMKALKLQQKLRKKKLASNKQEDAKEPEKSAKANANANEID